VQTPRHSNTSRHVAFLVGKTKPPHSLVKGRLRDPDPWRAYLLSGAFLFPTNSDTGKSAAERRVVFADRTGGAS
jgi:hypothetical protein